MENGTYEKQGLLFVCCMREQKRQTSIYFLQMETESGIVFLGRHMINGIIRLLFQKTCPFMPVTHQRGCLAEVCFITLASYQEQGCSACLF